MNVPLKSAARRHFERCEILLATIENLERPMLEDIVDRTGIPPRSIHAIFRRLEDQHRVVIKRINGRRHGYYQILDWGNLDRDKVIGYVTGGVRPTSNDLSFGVEVEREPCGV